MKLLVEEADIWWWVATNFNVSSMQGFKPQGLSPFTIPCLSLPDPCLSFTINKSIDNVLCQVLCMENLQSEILGLFKRFIFI